MTSTRILVIALAQTPPSTPMPALRTAVPFESLPSELVDAVAAYGSANATGGEPYIGYCSVVAKGSPPAGPSWCAAVLELTTTSALVEYDHAFASGGPFFKATFQKQAGGTWQAVPAAPATGTGVAQSSGSGAPAGLLVALGVFAAAAGGGAFAATRRGRSP